MTGRDRDETWSRMVAETLVILSVNFWLVREAAEMLEKRREISCADRSVKRLLASAVRPKDHDLDLIAHTHEARDILRSLQEVPDVLREVRK
jgi:hypothetical protein